MSGAPCTRGLFPSKRVCPKRGRCSTNRDAAKTPHWKNGLRKSAGRSYDLRACTPRSKPAISYENLKVPWRIPAVSSEIHMARKRFENRSSNEPQRNQIQARTDPDDLAATVTPTARPKRRQGARVLDL